ncbi:MAG: hypothetical protein M3N52_00360 [Actinomycetota bacterium]|nr:hypothetical protein [Actinomycetota bacterium]
MLGPRGRRRPRGLQRPGHAAWRRRLRPRLRAHRPRPAVWRSRRRRATGRPGRGLPAWRGR